MIRTPIRLHFPSWQRHSTAKHSGVCLVFSSFGARCCVCTATVRGIAGLSEQKTKSRPVQRPVSSRPTDRLRVTRNGALVETHQRGPRPVIVSSYPASETMLRQICAWCAEPVGVVSACISRGGQFLHFSSLKRARVHWCKLCQWHQCSANSASCE